MLNYALTDLSEEAEEDKEVAIYCIATIDMAYLSKLEKHFVNFYLDYEKKK